MEETLQIKKTNRFIQIVLIAIGFVALALGCVGIVLPILPTTPFLMLALICFTKGSIKFERWFISTKIYKKYLEPFVKTKAMTNSNKVKVLILVTILISIPIVLVDVLPMRLFLGAVILGHYVYFIFFVESVSKKQLNEMLKEIEAREKQDALEGNEKTMSSLEDTYAG